MTKPKPAAIETDREILSREQALAFLGVSHPTLKRMVRDGLPVTMVGRKMLFLKADIIAWLRSHQRPVR